MNDAVFGKTVKNVRKHTGQPFNNEKKKKLELNYHPITKKNFHIIYQQQKCKEHRYL